MGISWFMVADVETPEQRPKCDWVTDRNQPTAKPCGKEEGLFNVKRSGPLGGERKHVICDDHMNKAWKKWDGVEAERYNPKRTTG